MLRLVQLDRSYSPEIISVMMATFDRACQSVPKTMTDSNEVRKSIALTILRHVDRGELRLVQTALHEYLSDLGSFPDERLVNPMAAGGESARKKS